MWENTPVQKQMSQRCQNKSQWNLCIYNYQRSVITKGIHYSHNRIAKWIKRISNKEMIKAVYSENVGHLYNGNILGINMRAWHPNSGSNDLPQVLHSTAFIFVKNCNMFIFYDANGTIINNDSS